MMYGSRDYHYSLTRVKASIENVHATTLLDAMVPVFVLTILQDSFFACACRYFFALCLSAIMRTIQVYRGFWINHKYRVFLGLTLTTSRSQAVVLIAFFPLFIAFAGSELWRIISYIVHQTREPLHPRHDIHQQQQVLLRNTESTSRAAWDHLELALACRGRVKWALMRSLFIVCLATVYAVALVAGGLLSSNLATQSTEVLVSSPNCGDLMIIPQEAPGPVDDYWRQKIQYNDVEGYRAVVTAKSYAETCYGATADIEATGCKEFTHRDLSDKTTVTEIPCPFADDICQTSGVLLDSGILDSRFDMGINTPKADSIGFRSQAACAVLKQDGYVSDWQSDPIGPVLQQGPGGEPRSYVAGDKYKYFF